jgi:hypothetical protein
MRNYTGKDITNWLYEYDKHITHVAVAHTKIRPYNKEPWQIEYAVKRARDECRLFRRRFSQALYGMKALRKPHQFGPLMLTTIEGTQDWHDPSKTVHFNFALGNIPSSLTTEELLQVFSACWSTQRSFTTKKLWLEDRKASQTGWLQYITKEAYSGNIGTWDEHNTQIPHSALAAD